MNNTTTTNTATNTAENTATTATISNPNEKLYTINLVNNTKKWNIAKFSNKIDISNFTKPVKMFKYNPVAQMINNESNNFGQPTGNSYFNNYYKNNYYNNNNNNNYHNNNNNNNNAAATAVANAKNNSASVISTNTAASNTTASNTTAENNTTTTTTTTAAGTVPAATAIPRKKKFEPKPVNPKTIPWKLEDSEGNNTYQGNVEGNQASSNYFLFMFQSDGSIKAVPCNDWYNFRPKKQFQSLTTEEAEDFMKKKNQEWDIFTSRLAKNTAPVTADGKKSLEDEEELKGASKQELKYFSKMNVKSNASEPDKKNKRTNKKRREREDEGEGGEDGDAPDFESKFDDDDDDTYMDGDGLTGEDGPQIEEDEEEEQDLTAGGLEMKKMIKKQQQKNEDGEDVEDDDKKSKEGEEDDDEDDDEDPDQDDLSNIPKNLNGGAVKKEDGSDSNTSDAKGSKSSKKSKKQKDGSPKSKEKKSKKNKDGSERESKKAKKEKESAAVSSPPPQQQPSSPSQQSQTGGDSDPPFTQEYITKVLQKSKKVKSIDLINIFKGPLKIPENKQIFLSMVHNVARVVEENGTKYLIPK